MVTITVQGTNQDLDSFYRPLCDMQLLSAYRKDINFVNGETYFSVFLFLKCIKLLSELKLHGDICVQSCYFTSRTELLTVISDDDSIMETYYCYISTVDTGSFSFKVIPPHCINNRINNDSSFIEKAYAMMDLDPDFQFMGVDYDGVEEYPIKGVQLHVLMAFCSHDSMIERSDFLFICKEFYGMIKDLKTYENVRIKRIYHPNEENLSDYNPALLYLDCDNIDRVVHNDDTNHKFMIGYSTNYKKSYFGKNVKAMKLL